MRALMAWRRDWKSELIARILGHRRGTLIDVGANVGQTLLDFLSAPVRSTYLGFEPNLICYQHLAGLVSANALSECHVVPAALGDKNGISNLYGYGGDVDAGSTTLRELRPRLTPRGSSICMFRLDDLAGVLPEPEIALVKIDVEGSELEVLRGMEHTVARTRPWMLCEVLHRDRSAEAEPHARRMRELMRLISSSGYEVLRVERGREGITALQPVSVFPEVVWDDSTSPEACDYLFVPDGHASAARELLVP